MIFWSPAAPGRAAWSDTMKSAVPRWTPSITISKREQMLLKRLEKNRRLFAMLRLHRVDLFDDDFQDELATMYRDSGEGKVPVVPALLAMVLLLQAYTGVSDADAVEMTVVDARWQMVLDVLGAEEPAFSQGALPAFRERLIRSDMDRRLLERTVELAKKTAIFDWKKLPKTLRLAVDSRPLEGAGRVEDTINLLGHATLKLLRAAAARLSMPAEDIAKSAKAPVFLHDSIKKGLDIDWADPEQKAGAVTALVAQIDALAAWIRAHAGDAVEEPPLKELFALIAQLRNQDLEPDPSGGGPRVRKGVAEDRRVSIGDADMRHGRKSKSKRFNGFKQHLACDLDTHLILACATLPANRPEADAAPDLSRDLARYPERNTIGALYIDRGYVGSSLVEETLACRGEVLCRPWTSSNGARLDKRSFPIDLRSRTITCPAGQTRKFRLGQVVSFAPAICGPCPLRAPCTNAREGAARTIHIAKDEPLQKRLRTLAATSSGRARLRERVTVEHRLAHLSNKQGRRARYVGTRKNLLDLRRYAALLNLETIQQHEAARLAEAA
ncbi:Mobile element protein [Minicystis rosea]|nr:Mobile element protein [Minicystis rosea]